ISVKTDSSLIALTASRRTSSYKAFSAIFTNRDSSSIFLIAPTLIEYSVSVLATFTRTFSSSILDKTSERNKDSSSFSRTKVKR
ncbi:MAG: hypothetical protein IJJ47_04570, partial [Methanosphaera sp.]|nr:hypothetical protein [Methanosphaera sp.]